MLNKKTSKNISTVLVRKELFILLTLIPPVTIVVIFCILAIFTANRHTLEVFCNYSKSFTATAKTVGLKR